MKKPNREAVRERARDAIRELYHNATPSYPRLNDERAEQFQDWFQQAAEWEIAYLQGGGAYGRDYWKTLNATCNAGRYKSEKARAYYVRKGMRDMRLDQAKSAWERAPEYGKLFTWGRGGRTLAPETLVKQGGGSSFRMREEWPDERTIAECVELILIIESFNRYVAQWCASVPEQWAEYEREELIAGREDHILSTM